MPVPVLVAAARTVGAIARDCMLLCILLLKNPPLTGSWPGRTGRCELQLATGAGTVHGHFCCQLADCNCMALLVCRFSRRAGAVNGCVQALEVPADADSVRSVKRNVVPSGKTYCACASAADCVSSHEWRMHSGSTRVCYKATAWSLTDVQHSGSVIEESHCNEVFSPVHAGTNPSDHG